MTTPTCSLRTCAKRIDPADGRVEICGNIAGFSRSIPTAAIAWARDGNAGSAQFHIECYNALVDLAKEEPLPPQKRRAKSQQHSASTSKKAKKTSKADKVAAGESDDDDDDDDGADTSHVIKKEVSAGPHAPTKLGAMTAKERKIFLEAAGSAEFTDPLAALDKAVAETVEAFRASKHAVVFTGAGISTSSGIGDYRGKTGKWTQEDTGLVTSDDGVEYEDLRPSFPHEAIALLVKKGFIKYVISQNCDGLHLLSGIPRAQLSELHGNLFLEYCSKCRHEYERDYYTPDDSADAVLDGEAPNPGHVEKCFWCENNHFTGRQCTAIARGKTCGGELKDTLVHFGDRLGLAPILKAKTNAKKCDFMIALGTTMTVAPANTLVTMGPESRPFAIVNRQFTDADENGTIRYFGPIARFLERVLEQLVPAAELRAWDDERAARVAAYDSRRPKKH